MNYKKRLKVIYFNTLLILLLIITSVFAIPSNVVFSASGDPPSITISSPKINANIKDLNVVISGTYDDDNVADISDLIFTASEKVDNINYIISSSDIDSSDWNISTIGTDGKGTWSFSKLLEEGTHNISIEIKDSLDKVSNESVSFTVGLRPYISNMKVILPSGEVNAEDLTSVPENASIKITVIDDKPMDQLVGKIQATENPYYPITVKLGSNEITGTTTIEKDDTASQTGKYVYHIVFNSDKQNLLKLNTTYTVYVDSNLLDDSNNPIYARSFKITTRSDMDQEDNPHGHYALNTNTCAACHSPHNGKSASLDGGSYQITFNEKLKEDPSLNYCMACHDGTINAPIVDKINSTYQHNNPANYSSTETNSLKQPASCTSCHNPHLEKTEENPNMLKDHYVYTHNAAHPDEGLDTPTVDSLDISCDSCHDYVDFSNISTDKGKHETLVYKKSTTATGSLENKLIDATLKTVSDYSLCLRCHNAEKNSLDSNLADIETYYTNQNSGHYFALATNQTSHGDGTKLNGPIPCAECHDTHGSNNIMNLREELGNVKLSNSEKFKTTSTIWTAFDERTFCLKCHNNKTEIYGKTGHFNIIDDNGILITGHQVSDPQGCSNCHGGSTKSSIEAAHAPTKITSGSSSTTNTSTSTSTSSNTSLSSDPSSLPTTTP